MGLFDGLKNKTQPQFNTQKAVMTIVVSAVAADGNASDEEISRLRSMCARSPVFSANTREQDDAVIDFAVNVISQMDTASLLNAAAGALTPELKETAFAFAVEMVLADGMVGADEEAFISQLADALGIDEDLGRAVIQVTLIRARGE